MAESISLTPKEQYKLTIINQTLRNEMTNGQAGKLLGISPRQIRRLKTLVRRYAAAGVIHRLKGKPSNHRSFPVFKEDVLAQVRKTYSDFKPSFAAEKLREINRLPVHPQTLRRWMIEDGLWKERKRKKPQYRTWRPRKAYFGELEQFDGSYHDWFEKRYCNDNGEPIETCLLAAIDDATGKITQAQFTAHEGVIPVFAFWQSYIRSYGKPLAIYLDKFSTYKINHKNAVDNSELMTQFERLARDLTITLITAHSPEAKGRIERLFQTLQERLVKELRLANINTPQEGNRFLKEVFIPKFNAQFAALPEKEGNVHRVLTKGDKEQFYRMFSIQSTRKVNNDFTIQFKNVWYQLSELQPTTVRPRETVLVEEWLDETVHLSSRTYYLNYTILPERPRKAKTNPTIVTSHKLIWRPPSDHPWRKPFKIRS